MGSQTHSLKVPAFSVDKLLHYIGRLEEYFIGSLPFQSFRCAYLKDRGREDIVMFRSPENPNRVLVKRISVMEGDIVQTLPPHPEKAIKLPKGLKGTNISSAMTAIVSFFLNGAIYATDELLSQHEDISSAHVKVDHACMAIE